MSDEATRVDDAGQSASVDTSGTLLTGQAEQPGTVDDLSTLFTPEEVTAKREAVEQAKVEETRRAALTDDERNAEDAAKAKADADKKAPESYADFTAPDGAELDKGMIAEFVPIAKELGLTQSQAQRLIDLELALDSKRQEQRAQEVTSWAETAKKDSEFGGSKLDASLEIATRALNTFATPELQQALKDTGMGNHPEMIRLMYRMGLKMQEDPLITTQSGQNSATPEARLKNFYDKSNMT